MNRVKELRKAKGYSQSQMASILNVHQTAVSQWEQGRTSPDIDTAKKIAEHFNAPLDYVLGLNMTAVPIEYSTDLQPMYHEFARRIQDMGLDQSELDNLIALLEGMKKK